MPRRKGKNSRRSPRSVVDVGGARASSNRWEALARDGEGVSSETAEAFVAPGMETEDSHDELAREFPPTPVDGARHAVDVTLPTADGPAPAGDDSAPAGEDAALAEALRRSMTDRPTPVVETATPPTVGASPTTTDAGVSNPTARARDGEDAALKEAIRRSVAEQSREESELADALRASMCTHDEEVARDLQEKLRVADAAAAPVQVQAPVQEAVRAPEVEWRVVAKGRGTRPVPQTPVFADPPARPAAAHPPAARPVAARTSLARPAPVISFGSSAPVPRPLPAAPPSIPERVVLPPLRVVLDGLNIGCTFGGGGSHLFRARGIEIAVRYFTTKGHRSVALLPSSKLNPHSSERASVADMRLLRRMEADGLVAFLPARVNDDLFVIRVALDKGAFLVSNDQFRGELAKQRGTENTRRLKKFLKESLVPFVFVEEGFYPCPKVEVLSDLGSFRPARRF